MSTCTSQEREVGVGATKHTSGWMSKIKNLYKDRAVDGVYVETDQTERQKKQKSQTGRIRIQNACKTCKAEANRLLFSRLEGKRKMCKKVEGKEGCGVVEGKVGAIETASTPIKEASVGSLHGTESMCACGKSVLR